MTTQLTTSSKQRYDAFKNFLPDDSMMIDLPQYVIKLNKYRPQDHVFYQRRRQASTYSICLSCQTRRLETGA
jgi:hypothetical protein